MNAKRLHTFVFKWFEESLELDSVCLKIMVTERNHAVDLLKFLAAILITNSHMGALYPGVFHSLATGGAIGDGLFFFCSGYLLMMGKEYDFFNWYKRRINRIFPTVFAIAIFGILVFGKDPTLKSVIINGGGWFVKAILVFYAVFWFVKHCLSERMWVAYLIDGIIVMAWYLLFYERDVNPTFAGVDYFRWPCFFMIMLLGASSYIIETRKVLNSGGCILYLVLLVPLLAFYYGYQHLESRFVLLKDLQIVLLPALMGIIWCVYRICSNERVIKCYRNKYFYWPAYYISACCLEIYLCQWWCFDFGSNLIHYFPLNVIATFILVFIVAYLVKVFSIFLSQTFKTEKYDWKGMVKL